MAHTGVPQAPTDHSTFIALASRRLRSSVRTVPVAVVAVVAMVTAACAPPNSPAGSGDGGVSVTTVAPASTGAPVDVAPRMPGPMARWRSPLSLQRRSLATHVHGQEPGTIEHEMLVLKTDTPFDRTLSPIRDRRFPSIGADKIDKLTMSRRPAIPISSSAIPARSPPRSPGQLRARAHREAPAGMRGVTVTATAATPTTAPPDRRFAT